ncbi:MULTISPECIES: hypothetical protein [Rhizobium]|uniref:hypothetical protein n=1 Tax=Rhizobium TaxID=379 RepID=UPI0010312402|nr:MULTISPECIES: hypothetical protein [Rhizobium]TBD89806.1 hypothetical protein ELH14_09215 [Rhizobium ruizarguesonis]UIJ82289.1 hypothetical protein LZK78_25695 [Rhizobium leguminosarum]
MQQIHYRLFRCVLFAGLLVAASCSDNRATAVVSKFAESELHYIGTGCEGPFWAIRDGNFVAFDGAAYRVQMENVTLEDIGSHRVSMSSPLPKGNLVTTFLLKHDDTVAVIEGIRPVPDFTPEQWASAYGAQMRQASETLRASPSLVLCPASKS